MKTEDLIGVWRKREVQNADILRGRMSHMVFSRTGEGWEVYPWPLEFDDDPGAPFLFELNADGTLAHRQRDTGRIGACARAGDKLEIRWEEGLVYLLELEDQQATVQKLSVRPSPRPRPRRKIPGIGEVAYQPRLNHWAGHTTIDEQGVVIRIHDTGNASPDAGLTFAGQIVTRLRTVGSSQSIAEAAPRILDDWLYCCECGDRAPDNPPSPEAVAQELVLEEIFVDPERKTVGLVVAHHTVFEQQQSVVVLNERLEIEEIEYG